MEEESDKGRPRMSLGKKILLGGSLLFYTLVNTACGSPTQAKASNPALEHNPTNTPTPAVVCTVIPEPITPTSTPTIIIPTATPTQEPYTPTPECVVEETPTATPTSIPINLEYDMIVSGWLLTGKAFCPPPPGFGMPNYDALWNIINNKTEFLERQDIARVIIYDSKNQIRVDWKRADGSIALEDPYIINLLEQEVDDVIWKLTQQYRNEIVLVDESRLEAILKSQGKSLAGLAELLATQSTLTKEQIFKLLEDSYAVTLNPNIYCCRPEDPAVVSIIPSQDAMYSPQEVLEIPQQIKVNNEVYKEIFDYIGVPMQPSDPR